MSNDQDSGSTPSPTEPTRNENNGQSPLITTLNRLSLSTSRPNLPPQEGYATRTLRNVSTSLGMQWGEEAVPPTERRASASIDTTAILYPTLENHPAPLAHPLLVLDLASLTSVPSSISNDELLPTLLRRLEPWVGEDDDGGYCLIVLAAEDTDGRARGLPGVAWWMWHWRRIPRKKNLKRLYIVHPSTLTRTVLPILIPLVSPKSYAKLHTVPSLLGLARRGVSLAGIDLPLVTLIEETRVLREHPDAANGHAATNAAVHGSQTGWWGSVTSAFGWGAEAQQDQSDWGVKTESDAASIAKIDKAVVPFWSQDIDDILGSDSRLPRALRDITAVILRYCTDTEGVFRKSASAGMTSTIRAFLDLPPPHQPRIDWVAVAQYDPLLPSIMYLRLLGGRAAPVIPSSLYPVIRRSHTLEEIKTQFVPSLSPARAAVLEHTVHLAHHLLAYEKTTLMSARALAIVMAPALIAGDPREDAMMCMEPGRALSAGMAAMMKLSAALADSDDEEEQQQQHEDTSKQNTLVGLLETWITEYADPPGCNCGMPDTAEQTTRTVSSPTKTPFNLGSAGIAPPVES